MEGKHFWFALADLQPEHIKSVRGRGAWHGPENKEINIHWHQSSQLFLHETPVS